MELAILGTLATLVGLIAAVAKPMLSLTKTITKLTSAVERVSQDLDGLINKNAQSHERIHDRIDRNDGRLDDHETRITVLERQQE